MHLLYFYDHGTCINDNTFLEGVLPLGDDLTVAGHDHILATLVVGGGHVPGTLWQLGNH